MHVVVTSLVDMIIDSVLCFCLYYITLLVCVFLLLIFLIFAVFLFSLFVFSVFHLLSQYSDYCVIVHFIFNARRQFTYNYIMTSSSLGLDLDSPVHSRPSSPLTLKSGAIAKVPECNRFEPY